MNNNSGYIEIMARTGRYSEGIHVTGHTWHVARLTVGGVARGGAAAE